MLVGSARSSYSHLDLIVVHQLPSHFSDHTGPLQHSYLAPLKHPLGKARRLHGHYRTLLGHDLGRGTTYAQIGHYLDTQTNIDRVQKRMMKTINEMSIPGAGVEISILRRRTAQRLKLKLHFAVLWICCKATSGRIK